MQIVRQQIKQKSIQNIFKKYENELFPIKSNKILQNDPNAENIQNVQKKKMKS